MVPVGQFSPTESPARQRLPGGQGTGSGEFELQMLPSVQAVYIPFAQVAPIGQAVHSKAPALEYVPFGQGTGSVSG